MLITNYGRHDLYQFVKDNTDEGRFLAYTEHEVIEFTASLDRDNEFTYTCNIDKYAMYDKETFLRRILTEQSRGHICHNAYITGDSDYHLRDNTPEVIARCDIARQILGERYWNSLSMDDRAAATAYVYHYGQEDARKEGRYVGTPRLEEFLDDREFYTCALFYSLAGCAEDYLEMTGELDRIFEGIDEQYVDHVEFNFHTYAACEFEPKIKWLYVELCDESREYGDNDFKGIVWWFN